MLTLVTTRPDGIVFAKDTGTYTFLLDLYNVIVEKSETFYMHLKILWELNGR